MHSLYLTSHANYPNDYKSQIILKAFKRIILAVYFSTVKLIEERHKNEHVEYYGEVKTRRLELCIVVVFYNIVNAHPIFNFKKVIKCFFLKSLEYLQKLLFLNLIIIFIFSQKF